MWLMFDNSLLRVDIDENVIYSPSVYVYIGEIFFVQDHVNCVEGGC